MRKLFDEQVYAIKQVRVRWSLSPALISRLDKEGQEALENARGEVVMLSSLHNKHIVGYYTAWMEQEYCCLRLSTLGARTRFSWEMTGCRTSASSRIEAPTRRRTTTTPSESPTAMASCLRSGSHFLV